MISKSPSSSRYVIAFFVLAQIFSFSYADVGTATHYSPPYAPTACFGSDLSKFPTNNMFAAAGEGIWDNGAACGRQYQVRCFSASQPKACINSDDIITITIVDRAISTVTKPAKADTTMVLSNTAYNAIAQGPLTFVVIEYQEF